MKLYLVVVLVVFFVAGCFKDNENKKLVSRDSEGQVVECEKIEKVPFFIIKIKNERGYFNVLSTREECVGTKIKYVFMEYTINHLGSRGYGFFILE